MPAPNYGNIDTTTGKNRPDLPTGFSYDSNGGVIDAQGNPVQMGADGKPMPTTVGGSKIVGYDSRGYPQFSTEGLDLSHKPAQNLSLTSIAEGDYTPATAISDIYDYTVPQGMRNAISGQVGGGEGTIGGSYDAQKYLDWGTANAQAIEDLAMQRAREAGAPQVTPVQATDVTATNISTPEVVTGQTAKDLRAQRLGQIEAARTAPSAAEGQMRAGLGQTASAALAQAGAARGADRMSARRDAMLATQMGGMQAAGTTAALAAQEKAQKEAAATSGLAGLQASDITAGQVELEAAKANQAAELQAGTTTAAQKLAAQQGNQTASLQAYQLGTAAGTGYLGAATQAQGAGNQATQVASSHDTGMAEANAKKTGALAGAAGGIIGGLVSDEAAKQDIQPIIGKQDFLAWKPEESKEDDSSKGLLESLLSDEEIKADISPVGAGSPIFDDFAERTRGMSPKDAASLLSSYENLAASPSTPPTAHNRTWADFRGMNRDADWSTLNEKYLGLKRAEEAARSGVAMADTELSDEHAKREVSRMDGEDIADWAEAVPTAAFRYKRGIRGAPDDGERFHVGTLARELEGTGPMGEMMVSKDRADGLRQVEYGPLGLMVGKGALHRADEALDWAKAAYELASRGKGMGHG